MFNKTYSSIAVASFVIGFESASAAIIYVDDSATGGANSGTSWNDAYVDLQDGLKRAQSGDEVRVGQGSYKPAGNNGDRTATFSIPDGVIVNGGFAGVGAANPDANDPQQFETILSGDLNDNDGKPGSWFGYDENSYHVVTSSGAGRGSQLSGVTVRAGSADDTDTQSIHSIGGGVLVETGTLGISQCTIEDNQAFSVGGGMSAAQATVDHTIFRRNRQLHTFGGSGGAGAGPGSSFVDCSFESNRAGNAAAAGGLSISGGTVERCTFIGNFASEQAGGMASFGQTSVINSQFSNNGGGVQGGGIWAFSGTITISECTFVDNVASEGGALAVIGATASVRDCDFGGNRGTIGGALNNSGTTTIVRSRFNGNSIFTSGGGAGGAIGNTGQLDLINCVFQQNSSHDFAGVIYNAGSGTLKAVNSRFTNNHSQERAGVLHNAASAELVNCTVAANLTRVGSTINDSGALHNRFDGKLTVNNCIVFANETANGQGGETAQIWNEPGGAVTVNNSFVEGWTGAFGGVGNSGANPGMVNDSDNFRLTEGSPCINAGDNAWLPTDSGDVDDDGDTAEIIPLDLDMHARIVSGVVDVGAYEFQGEVKACAADIAPEGGNGTVDTDDLLLVINNWGATGENPGDVTGNGVVDVDDLLAVINAWGPCS